MSKSDPATRCKVALGVRVKAVSSNPVTKADFKWRLCINHSAVRHHRLAVCRASSPRTWRNVWRWARQSAGHFNDSFYQIDWLAHLSHFCLIINSLCNIFFFHFFLSSSKSQYQINRYFVSYYSRYYYFHSSSLKSERVRITESFYKFTIKGKRSSEWQDIEFLSLC